MFDCKKVQKVHILFRNWFLKLVEPSLLANLFARTLFLSANLFRVFNVVDALGASDAKVEQF